MTGETPVPPICSYSFGSIYDGQSVCYLTAAKFVINLFFSVFDADHEKKLHY
jgi:hypothetical protein